MFWKVFAWGCILNTGIIALPSIVLPLLARGGPDVDGLQLMAVVAGVGVVLGVVLVVFPCALATTARFVARFEAGFHFVPYAALVPYMIAAMGTTGLFSMYLMVLQFIVAIALHLVIALRLRPRARVSDAAASR